MQATLYLVEHKGQSTDTVLPRLGCCGMSMREESPRYATDIDAISPSEAAIAVDPIHAKSVPQTKDV